MILGYWFIGGITKMNKRDKNGQFERIKERYLREELIETLINSSVMKDPQRPKAKNYKNGQGEKYVRILLRGRRIKRSHIVWMIGHNKLKVPVGKDVHHRNENKKDDRLWNLELADSRKHGNGNLKYTKNYNHRGKKR